MRFSQTSHDHAGYVNLSLRLNVIYPGIYIYHFFMLSNVIKSNPPAFQTNTGGFANKAQNIVVLAIELRVFKSQTHMIRRPINIDI